MVEIIPKEQLLVFETGKDSYGKLASFLNVPTPEEPYPRSNRTREMKFIILFMKALALIAILLPISVVVSILFLGIQRLMVRKRNIKVD